MTNTEFRFLEDRPIEASEGSSPLKFGHAEIVNALSQMIEKCPTPFTIGLFAKWGAGKSSVANSLREPLLKLKVPIVVFDVWKHEGDALRRTFLKETERQLEKYGKKIFPKLPQNHLVDKSIVQAPLEGGGIDWPKIKRSWWIIPSTISFLILLHYLGNIWAAFDGAEPFIYGILGVVFSAPVIVWFMDKFIKYFSTETTIYGVDRYSDPFQFEDEFLRILGNMKCNRILIVFDNLDRVGHDQVEKVLSTIKTFLEPKGKGASTKEVVFLIPCDARAIKHHLSNIYGTSDGFSFDADEFLRKFFNTILWIPEFIPGELENFAQDTLRATKVALLDNPYVAWIIIKAFRNNPRQVIQFVNILLANFLLIEEREGDGRDFPEDFLSGNVPQLTKFLVLNQLFPEEMSALRVRKVPNLETVTEKDIAHADPEKKPSFEASERAKQFIDFIRETPDIPISELGIFFTLRRSEQEKKFPSFSQFVSLLDDKKVQDAKEYFLQYEQSGAAGWVADFSQAVKRTMDQKTNPVSLATFIDGLLCLLVESGVILTSTVNAELNNAITLRCKEVMQLVSPKYIQGYLLARNRSYMGPMSNLWFGILNSFDAEVNEEVDLNHAREVFEVMVDSQDVLTKEQIGMIKDLLAKEGFNCDARIGEIVVSTEEGQRKFCSTIFVTLQIEQAGLAAVDLSEILQGLVLVTRLTDYAIRLVDPQILFSRLTAIQVAENSRTFDERSKGLLEGIRMVIERHLEFLKSAAENVRDPFVAALIAGFNGIADADSKGVMVPTLFSLKRISSPAQILLIEAALKVYLSGCTPMGLRSALDELPAIDREGFFVEDSLYALMEGRALAEEPFRSEFFADFPRIQQETFLRKFMTADFVSAISFIASLETDDSAIELNVFRQVVAEFKKYSVVERKAVLSVIGNYVEIADVEDVEDLARAIARELLESDTSLQELGYAVLQIAYLRLPGLRVRQITKEILDQLTLVSLINKYQPSAIKSVFLGYAHLNSEEKGSLQHFVFDELIRKSADVFQIEFSFELLKKVDLHYSDRKENFDDVFRRAEIEPVEEMRKALRNGLKSIAPASRSEEDREFWDSVDLLE